MQTKFWNTLFEPEERINLSSTVKGTEVVPLNWLKSINYNTDKQFFCVNPLKEKRSDANVECFRNILIEFDKLSLKDQIILSSDMPHSTSVFSGNKSIHLIISLKEPCKDIKEYKALIKRIQDKLPDMDKSTSNPSRLSRTPGAIRDNGQKQYLYAVNGRVSTTEIEAWLGPAKLKTEQQFVPRVPVKNNKKRLLPIRVLEFIEYGTETGGRNQALFANACELFRANYTFEEIEEIAHKVLDLPSFEIRQCIASAQKAVTRE